MISPLTRRAFVHIAAISSAQFSLYNPPPSLASTPNPPLSPTIIVTGANSGIGAAVAKQLSDRGIDVICACRTIESSQTAALDAGVNARALNLPCDLADLLQVSAFAKAAVSAGLAPSVLCCAGVEGVPQLTRTAQGIEMQFGVNVVGHFALVAELLCRNGRDTANDVRKQPLRVVFVSSSAALDANFSSNNDFQFSKQKYNPRTAYVNSKAGAVLLADELNDRCGSDATSAVLSCSIDPGPTATQIVRYTLTQRATQRAAMTPEQRDVQAKRLSLRTPTEAAMSAVWLLTQTDTNDNLPNQNQPVEGGFYLGAGAAIGSMPPPPLWNSVLLWRNSSTSKALWKTCAELSSPYLTKEAQAFIA